MNLNGEMKVAIRKGQPSVKHELGLVLVYIYLFKN